MHQCAKYLGRSSFSSKVFVQTHWTDCWTCKNGQLISLGTHRLVCKDLLEVLSRTDMITKNSPSAHYRTTFFGCIFATKACIDKQKELVKQQYLLHAFSQYGELQPISG